MYSTVIYHVHICTCYRYVAACSMTYFVPTDGQAACITQLQLFQSQTKKKKKVNEKKRGCHLRLSYCSTHHYHGKSSTSDVPSGHDGHDAISSPNWWTWGFFLVIFPLPYPNLLLLLPNKIENREFRFVLHKH
ncbi:uncharacterized protein F4822DRAFT_116363 [Hypoxylon trugodes]|uniref:uncharacterized protein n=1 Tax=Hypoxylon trugodes TaxID=326681 RepID=UPI0021974980|nr:uncharacterized protein F4822DRAFT_116363 [Hypoxylon trugodes]KAI1392132.1 hypothetical protein F4822DRAFT_116363 [Hypoxylon trugodes]